MRASTPTQAGRDDLHVVPLFLRVWGRRGSRPCQVTGGNAGFRSGESLFLCTSLLCLILSGSALAGDYAVRELRCEYADDPLGVDVSNPRLFWKLDSHTRGQRQTAYEI